MSLGSFIRKQFIDILQWNEDRDGVLAWRHPMQDFEIQYGASLTVRESQMAVFVNEGKVADVFGPGMYKLTTQTLPILTYLKNWDKLFESPFKSDVIFFSTRLQLGRRWGTAQPITVRDAEFGISPETVRFHLKSIYEKFGVNDRRVVVELAQQRGLLPDQLSGPSQTSCFATRRDRAGPLRIRHDCHDPPRRARRRSVDPVADPRARRLRTSRT